MISDKIKPKELPFKAKLLRLNKIRVNSKHYGIMPSREECERIIISVREFFEEVSSSVLDVNFSTVSTIDLLKDGKAKEYLLQVQKHLNDKEFEECSIFCRKAIYQELLWNYNISKFQDPTKSTGLLSGFSNAPYYARNKDYIEQGRQIKIRNSFDLKGHFLFQVIGM